jgi:hypothetical protein
MMTLYSILISVSTPLELIELFSEYIHHSNSHYFLICNHFENKGYFSKINMISPDKNKKTWCIYIQTQYVLSISEVNEADKKKFLVAPKLFRTANNRLN